MALIMTLDGSRAQLLGGKSKAGMILDSALDSLSGLRGPVSFGLLGPVDTVKAHPIILVGGVVLGAWLAGMKFQRTKR